MAITRTELPNGCIKKVFTLKGETYVIKYFDSQKRRHREDGPAIIYPRTKNNDEFYIHGKFYDKKTFHDTLYERNLKKIL